MENGKKSMSFVVTVEFTGEVYPVETVGMNIANAVRSYADNGPGIAPEDSEHYTKSITVSESGIEITSITL